MGFGGLPSYDGPIWRVIRWVGRRLGIIEPELERREVWDPVSRTVYTIHVEPGTPPLEGEKRKG